MPACSAAQATYVPNGSRRTPGRRCAHGHRDAHADRQSCLGSRSPGGADRDTCSSTDVYSHHRSYSCVASSANGHPGHAECIGR